MSHFSLIVADDGNRIAGINWVRFYLHPGCPQHCRNFSQPCRPIACKAAGKAIGTAFNFTSKFLFYGLTIERSYLLPLPTPEEALQNKHLLKNRKKSNYDRKSRAYVTIRACSRVLVS